MSQTPTFRIHGPEGERAAALVRARLDERRARGVFDDGEIERVASTGLHTFDGDDTTAEIFRRCCVTWEVDRPPKLTSHRPGIGVAIVAVKRVVRRLLRFQTEAQLSRQRDFNWNLLLLLRQMLERDRRSPPPTRAAPHAGPGD
jgi:hypothetical protein